MTMTTANDYIKSLQPGSTTSTATKSAKKNDTLDQTAFLKLMTTQLQTQDPFNPVDNTQMVAQMAQFSSVTGIAEMNASLKTITAQLSGSRIGDAASWIGRAALVKSDTVTPMSDGAYAGQITLPSNATRVSLSLIDANGQIVHSEDFGAQAKGDVGFAWDGKGADGTTAATGPLSIRLTAQDAKGNIKATTAAWTGVQAVQSPAGGASTKLVTPLGLIAPEDAIRLG